MVSVPSFRSRYPLLTLLSLFLCMTVSSAGDVPTTTIHGILQFPDSTPFNETTLVSLNFDEYNTYSRVTDGSFTIHNVKPGIHVIDVHNTVYHFSQIKIQLLEESMDEPKCLEYMYAGAAKISVPCLPAVRLNAIAKYDYFEKRAGFSIFSMLRNPMIIMMLFSVGLMFLMPKMMDQLEPEEKARMKQQMAMQSDPSKMLGQLWEDIKSGGAQEEPQRRKIKK